MATNFEEYQRKHDIIITQEGYAKKLLKNVGMYDCNPTLIPMDSKSSLVNSSVMWCSRKQEKVALSSCEAEYMVACAVSCQAIWFMIYSEN